MAFEPPTVLDDTQAAIIRVGALFHISIKIGSERFAAAEGVWHRDDILRWSGAHWSEIASHWSETKGVDDMVLVELVKCVVVDALLNHDKREISLGDSGLRVTLHEATGGFLGLGHDARVRRAGFRTLTNLWIGAQLWPPPPRVEGHEPIRPPDWD